MRVGVAPTAKERREHWRVRTCESCYDGRAVRFGEPNRPFIYPRTEGGREDGIEETPHKPYVELVEALVEGRRPTQYKWCK